MWRTTENEGSVQRMHASLQVIGLTILFLTIGGLRLASLAGSWLALLADSARWSLTSARNFFSHARISTVQWRNGESTSMAKKAEQTEMEPKNPAEGIRVFVYGTLKRGHSNHYLLEGDNFTKDTKFVGRCYIEGSYQMRHLGGFPGVQRADTGAGLKNRVYGEVYVITEETLKALDIMEGNGHFFTRDQIHTPWKKAWMYMIPPSFDRGAIVGNGCWHPAKPEEAFVDGGKMWAASAPEFTVEVETGT